MPGDVIQLDEERLGLSGRYRRCVVGENRFYVNAENDRVYEITPTHERTLRRGESPRTWRVLREIPCGEFDQMDTQEID